MGALFSAEKQEINEVIKAGAVQIQYGLKAAIFDRWITITKTQINIYGIENTSHLLASIPLHKLLNIDVSHNDNNINYFQALFNDKQHPIINVYCTSSLDRKTWVQLFEKYCPNVILTKELQTVKNCARNMCFKADEIEEALIKYHEKYGSMYSVHEFTSFLLKIRDKTEEKKEIDEENRMEAMTCSICKGIYQNPVRNIHDKTYCYQCICHWFDIIKENQHCFRDPMTNKKLPAHCRLLIPHFSLMVETWNNRHPNYAEQIHDSTRFSNIDAVLDAERQKILKYLLKMDDYNELAQTIAAVIMKSDTFKFSENDLSELLNESMECYQAFVDIKRFIKEGTQIYNQQIKRIFMNNNKQNDHLFEWKEPKWDNFISKTCINWCQTYQVHDMLFLDIESDTNKMMKKIKGIIEDYKDNTQQIKDQIIKNILQFQQEKLSQGDYEKNEYVSPISNLTEKQQFKRVKLDRIFYTEHNGLVNTKVIQEIAECIKHNRAFQLYHNDLHGASAKTMKRDKIVRFLETAGMDGISTQYHMYKNFALFIKNNLFNLSKYLKQNDAESYWKHLKEVEIIPQKNINPKEWSEDNDKVELLVTLDLDYDKYLETHNNDKNALSQSIQQQIMRHLGLKCLPEHVTITNVEKGSIRFVICFHCPLIALVAAALWFGYDVYKYCTEPNYTVSWYRTVTQGAIVGAGIGGILAAKTSLVPAVISIGAIMIPFGPIGAIIAGTVVVGMIGFGVWKYMQKRKGHIANQINSASDTTESIDDAFEDVKNEDMDCHSFDVNATDDPISFDGRIRIDQPGGGYYQRLRVSIEDQKHRITPNQVDQTYSVKLECGHCMRYDPNDNEVGNHVYCVKCGTMSDIGKIINIIRDLEKDGDVAQHSIEVLPGNFMP